MVDIWISNGLTVFQRFYGRYLGLEVTDSLSEILWKYLDLEVTDSLSEIVWEIFGFGDD